ncbi:hypothetical protein [Gilvimarinus xylanilyticus]|uniref:Uncharacterized protein n=1 Tax=Gilvimarinus xylanilyticus TaxID=2944139 RepID=A0A9X2HUC1_9GAMM|nr:hypothetical protein [Gilvimarinus xylanilyticus]MCP8898623.1 hypothetical protein [Gilvimarinus xylanilyticus]
MSLSLVVPTDLSGHSGADALLQLKQDMAAALAEGDFDRVRQLDQTFACVLDKLSLANRDNRTFLLNALLDVKQHYAQLLRECERVARAHAV